jgi:aminoglycoside phosphotransferase (APT) family kinase protein
MYRIAPTPRPHWEELPASLRRRITTLAGSEVIEAATATSGFSNGFAGRLTLNGRHRVFVKVMSEQANPVGARMYRDEVGVLQRMPREAPVPRLLDSFEADIGGERWVCLLVEHIDGRAPDLRRSGELDRVIDLTMRLAELDPSPISDLPLLAAAAGTFDRWRAVDAADEGVDSYDPWLRVNLERVRRTASSWSSAIAGTALVHGDLRPDNIVVTDQGAWAVDWPSAGVGAGWVDTLLMLPALAMLADGPDPAEVAARHPLLSTVDHDAVDAALAAALGYFVTSSLLDPPPGLPTVRAFQRAQADVIVRWLRDRWR